MATKHKKILPDGTEIEIELVQVFKAMPDGTLMPVEMSEEDLKEDFFKPIGHSFDPNKAAWLVPSGTNEEPPQIRFDALDSHETESLNGNT